MPIIHPTAMVSNESVLAEDVVIGPWCVLTGRVTLGAGVRLLGNNYIAGEGGPVIIGKGTILYPFACIGFEPQDFKFKPGAKSAGVIVGENCLIREHVTVHAASNDHTPTKVGNGVFMMVNTHVAHDGSVGNNVVMVNGSGLAGHGIIGDNTTLGGNAVIHQFCRIGRMVMMSGDCAVSLDVPPFCMVNERNRIGGLNIVGLRRSGMPRDQITELRRAFRDLLRRPMPRAMVVSEMKARAAGGEGKPPCPPLLEMAEFIESSKRGITPGMGKPARDSLKQNAVEQEGVGAAED